MKDPWHSWDEEFDGKLHDVRNARMQRSANGLNDPHAAILQRLAADGEDWKDIPKTWSERLNFGLYHYEDLTVCPASFMRYTNAAVGRCTVFITSAGFVGVAPTCISKGDVISIVHGSSMPVILRPDDEFHTFQGLAYVHGIISGELAGIDVESTEEVELRIFEVR